MLSTRSILSFFLALSAFVLFVNAGPVVSDLVAREPSAIAAPVVNDLVVRSCTNCCSTAGCNEQAILDILINLQAIIDVNVKLLDGIVNPGKYVTIICTAIKEAVTLLAKVEISIGVAGHLLVDILDITVHIILSLAKAVSKYGLLVLLAISLKIDASLAGLVNILCGLIPTLQHLLSITLQVSIDLLLSVKFVLTLLACAL
jgi:hypothetical protein